MSGRNPPLYCIQLTTSRIGNLTRLIHTAICDDHIYIHTYYTLESMVMQVHQNRGKKKLLLFLWLGLSQKDPFKGNTPRSLVAMMVIARGSLSRHCHVMRDHQHRAQKQFCTFWPKASLPYVPKISNSNGPNLYGIWVLVPRAQRPPQLILESALVGRRQFSIPSDGF